MKRVETRIYRTPTKDNADCPWSIGVLNLTEAEANMVRRYAEGIRSVNSPRASGYTATEMRERRYQSDLEQTVRAQAIQRAMVEAAMTAIKPPDPRDEMGESIYQDALRRDRERKKEWWLTGDWDDGVAYATKTPELDEPRNRFSGLDLDDEPQTE